MQIIVNIYSCECYLWTASAACTHAGFLPVKWKVAMLLSWSRWSAVAMTSSWLFTGAGGWSVSVQAPMPSHCSLVECGQPSKISVCARGLRVENYFSAVREEYGDSAVCYIQLKRDNNIYTVTGRVFPEHKIRINHRRKCFGHLFFPHTQWKQNSKIHLVHKTLNIWRHYIFYTHSMSKLTLLDQRAFEFGFQNSQLDYINVQ